MRIAQVAPLVAILSLAFANCASQPAPQPSPKAPVQAAAPSPTPNTPGGPSSQLKPSLDAVQQVMVALSLDRWKRGTVRTEAADKIRTVLRDLYETLPPLLAAADAAPGSMSKQLPVSQNLDALYDVLLRIFEAARVSAPPEQITQLDQALAGLNTARRAYDDRLEESALALEKQMSDLQATVKAQAAIKCPVLPPPVVPVCPAPPVPKPRRKPKPAVPQPTTPPAAATTPNPKPSS